MNDRLLSIPPSLRQRPALCSPAQLARRANILALLDRAAAMQRIVSKVPQLAGVDVAWVLT